jgi:hypothetical protein
MTKLSVVICTRNPRHDVFPHVLAALASQTLPAAAAWTDFVPTCLDNGIGSSRFTALHLTHVIAAGGSTSPITQACAAGSACRDRKGSQEQARRTLASKRRQESSRSDRGADAHGS